jgi:cytochrome c-type biogenesis protein CcsB
MAFVFLKLAAFVYAVATVTVAAHILRPRPEGERRVLTAILAGIIVHALAVGGRTVEMSAFPLAGVQDALSLFAFISGMIAVVTSVRGNVPQVAWLTTPLTTLLVVVAAMAEPVTSVPESLRSLWLSLHIALALMGDAAFVIAGVVAVVYLMQERRLKHRKKKPRQRGKKRSRSDSRDDIRSPVTGLMQLPALERLDGVNLGLFKFGFPMMTLGIITGVAYGKQVLDVYWTWDTRNTVTALVWILYAAILHARLVIGWRGRKAAILTVVGVIAILLTFVGLGLTSSGMHGRETIS